MLERFGFFSGEKYTSNGPTCVDFGMIFDKNSSDSTVTRLSKACLVSWCDLALWGDTCSKCVTGTPFLINQG